MASQDLNIILNLQDKATKELSAFQGKLKGFEGAIKGAGVASGIVFAGIATAIGVSVQKAGEMEQIEVAFSTMLKSGEKAKTMLKELNQFASETPYEFEEIAKASRSLLAFGIPAEKMKDELRMIGDIASGIKQPIGEIAEIYGKAKVQGRLYGEDINQLLGRGIPIIQELAKQFGVTEQAVKSMVSDGSINFAHLQVAFQNMTKTGGQFNDMMKAQSTTFNGLTSTLSDAVNQTLVVIGTQFLPILKEIVIWLIPVLTSIQAWVAEHPKLTAGILLTTLAIAGLVTAGLALVVAIGAINVALVPLGITLGVLMIKLILISAVIIAVIAVGWMLYKNWKDIWGAIQIVFATVANGIMGAWEAVVNFIIDGINNVIKNVNRMISAVQAIPIIGSALKGIGQISLLERVKMDKFDTGLMWNNLVDKKYDNLQSPTGTNVTITGNTFMGTEDMAEKVGDMIINKLGLSKTI